MTDYMDAGANTGGVTIVVPVYGAVDITVRCVQSVIDHVDLAANRLLIVNDLGPDADVVETAILGLIGQRDGIRYVRNPRNLGFVETCNRAVLELDASTRDVLLLNSDAALTAGALEAMTTVLAANEKHGVVCARSNDATIATIPFLRRRPELERDVDVARSVFEAVKEDLPEWTVSPVAIGFCFLLRRSLVQDHGLFDEAFSPGYDEENDFCLRINDLGFSSLIANRAFVTHASSSSFGATVQASLQKDHEQELRRRYPFYPSAVGHHLRFERDVVDQFADLLAPQPDVRPSILIDLHHMSLHYDGSVRNALSFLEALRDRAPELNAQFSIQTSAEAIEFFNLERFGFPIHVNGEVDRVYDAAFALSPLAHANAILSMNSKALRWMVSHLDIISLRSERLRAFELSRRQIVLDSLIWADRVVSISASTTRDTLAFFPTLNLQPPRLIEIPQGHAAESFPPKSDDIGLADLEERTRLVLAEGGYIVVIGNGFPHKQVLPALVELAPLGRPIVSFGQRSTYGLNTDVIHELPTGAISDVLMSQILDGAGIVVFPSGYEGFGLPLAEAATHGRRIVTYRSAAVEETVAVLGIAESVVFFERFSELGGLVETILTKSPEPLDSPPEIRTMRQYNEKIIDELMDLVQQPVDLGALRARWAHFMAIGEYIAPAAQTSAELRALLNATRSTRSYRITVRILNAISPARRRLGAWRLRRRLR